MIKESFDCYFTESKKGTQGTKKYFCTRKKKPDRNSL